MRKVTAFVFPGLVLLIFSLFLLNGPELRRPLPESSNVNSILSSLETSVNDNDWTQASTSHSELKNEWQDALNKLQYISTKDDISKINDALAQMKGYIAAKNKPGTLSQLELIRQNWNDIGK
jgi:hypothetical protein